MNKKTMLVTLAMLVAVSMGAKNIYAQDPLAVAPDMYQLLQENDRVRIMQVTFQPGQQIAEHSHPDHFVYVLEAGSLSITKADGTVSNIEAKVGDVFWIDAESHSAVNTGTTVVRLLVVELKEPKPAAAAVEAVPAQ